MNILFLSLLDFESIEEHNIYTDLLREFRKEGHKVFAVSPVEKRNKGETRIIDGDNVKILKVKIGNVQKTGFIEKGISTLLLERQMINSVKKHFGDIRFGLVLYPTPPITLLGVVKYIKNRDKAKTYLMLKDIFPQGAVDLGILKTTGLKGIIYRYFRYKEKQLYAISDYIGCMSQANVDYVLEHNKEVNKEKVYILPNAIEVEPRKDIDTATIRRKYGIPLDVKVFIYGGNLGKPQGVPFLVECLKANENRQDAFFVICGAGTEYHLLDTYVNSNKPGNVLLINGLLKDEYNSLVKSCDVGMIFLDDRFTIPNFPSRLLSYMQAGIPILACTDYYSDIGETIVAGEFGWWCQSDSVNTFSTTIASILEKDLVGIGDNAKAYLINNYTSNNAYKIIMNTVNTKDN